MASAPDKVDSATLPESFQATVEDAARRDGSVLIERGGEVVGVVISPRDYALLVSRKRALARLGQIVETLRSRFDDLPEEEAIARAEEAALRTRSDAHMVRSMKSGVSANP